MTVTFTTTQWLQELYANTPSDGWLTIWATPTKGPHRTLWAPLNDIASLLSNAKGLRDTHSLYFGVAPRSERVAGSRRGDEQHCVSIPAFWVDIDIYIPGWHVDPNLPPTLDDAYTLLNTFPIPPTSIIETGGGLQAWWALKSPVIASEAKPILAAWKQSWKEAAAQHGWSIDDVFDLPRVMRLPGTTNHKGPAAVTIRTANWENRFNLDDITQWLTLPKPEPEPELDPSATSPPTLTTVQPGTDWIQRTTWKQLLEADGYKHAYRAEEEDHWTRPNKPGGTSVTTNYQGSDLLKVFSSNAPHLEQGATYNRHAYLAMTRFKGDFGAATQWLAEQGYGTPSVERIDPATLISTLPIEADTSTTEWPEPQPISRPPNLPSWPVHVLPNWASAHATNTAEQLQVPVDLCAQLALGTIATALMGHANVACGPNWKEPVNLYLATAMHSGAGKSPAEKHIAGPLREWERKRQADEAPRLVQARLEKDLADQRAKKARDEAIKGTISINEAARIATEAELLPTPHPYRLTADDATPEAIFSLLHQHDERLAILSTEADILDMAAGTYGRDGKVNVSIYLKAWSGDSAQRDRKGSGNQPAETLKLARPLLTCSITIQPALLDDYRTSNPLLRSRGFFARFMWSVPTATIGGRDRTLAFTRSTDTRSAWGEHLVGLADRWSRFLNPAELHCSPEAIEAFSAWITDMEPELADGRRLEPIRDPSSKIQSSVLRTVALLHLADGHPQDEPVSAATMLRAIEIGDYWVEHSLYVEGGNESGNPAVERQAKVLLDWTRSQRRREFTPRDFYANRRTEFESALSTGPLFELLVDRGWLRCTVGCVTDIGQRGKTVRFEVHPSNFTKGAQ
jgi:hypothetical protein